MKVSQHISLKPYNTFGIDVSAAEVYFIEKEEDIINLWHRGVFQNPFIVLGGGSNVLLTKNIDCPVIINQLEGIEVKSQTENDVIVGAKGGGSWHGLVQYCLERNWGGLENLSLIPGTVGAAPMQNIGAYGVEIKDVFHSLKAFSFKDGSFKNFTAEECAFGYRDSVFKGRLKNQYFIVEVCFTLSAKIHQLHTEYGAIGQMLAQWQITSPDIRDVSKAVCAIRSSKLPNPLEIGNSGSFFKNPILSSEEYANFSQSHPAAPAYHSESGVKIAAGWLIEQCGFKGVRYGNTGCHHSQALVLVNYGGATGTEVLEHAKRIQETVKQQFGVQLDMEVNVI